jgi:hypothetical protein
MYVYVVLLTVCIVYILDYKYTLDLYSHHTAMLLPHPRAFMACSTVNFTPFFYFVQNVLSGLCWYAIQTENICEISYFFPSLYELFCVFKERMLVVVYRP